MNGYHSHSAHSEAYQRLARASKPAYPTPTPARAYPTHHGHGHGHGHNLGTIICMAAVKHKRIGVGNCIFEFHRGTHTSHGSIKKGNRHSEILLRDVEHVATLASLTGKKYVYPKQALNDAWEKVLLDHFHDVLPGSAIGMVYDDAEKLYEEVREAGEKMLDDALDVILGGHTRVPGVGSATEIDQLVASNTMFFPRCEVVQVPLPAVRDSALRTQIAQVAQLAADGKAGAFGGRWEAVGLAAPPVTEAWGFTPVSVYTNGGVHFVLRNASVQLTISRG